jgi:hypothetical protein
VVNVISSATTKCEIAATITSKGKNKNINNHLEFFEIVKESVDNYTTDYIKEKELTVSACLAPLALA